MSPGIDSPARYVLDIIKPASSSLVRIASYSILILILVLGSRLRNLLILHDIFIHTPSDLSHKPRRSNKALSTRISEPSEILLHAICQRTASSALLLPPRCDLDRFTDTPGCGSERTKGTKRVKRCRKRVYSILIAPEGSIRCM